MTNESNKKLEQIPQVGEQQINLLEKLCKACSVSGDENEVRSIVLEQVSPLADDIKVDAIGNVLAIRKGRGHNRLRVMIAAHMDEVGFMLTGEDEDGFFRFDLVGGLDVRQLVGKPVWVGRDHIPGVIGAKPVHLTTRVQRNRVISLDSLRIDIGNEKSKKVKVGDRATFATPFRVLGPSVQAKALDDRIGIVNLIELFKYAPENIDLMAAFTVQEEVGLRGAQVAAYALDPQLGIALDCTPAGDLPSWESSNFQDEQDRPENSRYNVRLGAGPALYVADRATIADPRWIRHLIDTAESNLIPYQIRQPGSGGTDAGAIHRQRGGIPSVSVSVPARYIHTAAGIARLDDWSNTLALIYYALSSLTPEFFSKDR